MTRCPAATCGEPLDLDGPTGLLHGLPAHEACAAPFTPTDDDQP